MKGLAILYGKYYPFDTGHDLSFLHFVKFAPDSCIFSAQNVPSKLLKPMTRLNDQQIQTMKEELTVELANWLMETYGYPPRNYDRSCCNSCNLQLHKDEARGT